MQRKPVSLRILLPILNAALICGLAGCTVTEPEPESESEAMPPPAVGSLIAPPPGATPSKTLAQENAGRRFLEDPDAESVDYSAPMRRNMGSDPVLKEQQMKAKKTDAELSAVEGGLGSEFDSELGRVERELNLEMEAPPATTVPSFSLGTAKIKKLYREQKFEEALIATNDMLESYPRSPQLLMMKGTLHQWLAQLDLALAAYRQAFLLRPSTKLKAQIRFLEIKISERERMRPRIEGEVIPEGVELIETLPAGSVTKPHSSPATPSRPGGSLD